MSATLKYGEAFLLEIEIKDKLKIKHFMFNMLSMEKNTWDHTIYACLCANMGFGILLFSDKFLYSW